MRKNAAQRKRKEQETLEKLRKECKAAAKKITPLFTVMQLGVPESRDSPLTLLSRESSKRIGKHLIEIIQIKHPQSMIIIMTDISGRARTRPESSLPGPEKDESGKTRGCREI